MSGGKFGNDKFDCNGPEAVEDAPHRIEYHNDRKVTLTIRLEGPGIDHVACQDIDTYMLREALQPMKVSDSDIGFIFDMQSDKEKQDVMNSRDNLWRKIQSSMQHFFFEKVFTKNDTHNGYKESER